MALAAAAAVALSTIVAQANRPTLGPTAGLWVWLAPGLSEVVADGADERDLILSAVSTDLRAHTVEVRALGADGREIGRGALELTTALPVELAVETVFAPGAAPRTQRFTLVLGGLDASPVWLVIGLRSQSSACGTDYPQGAWVQADPTVVRQLLGSTSAGGS